MKHTILFLAANPLDTDRVALDREARAIQVELERSGFRDRFELVTRWAAEPLDLLRELRKLKPTVVHFSGHGTVGIAGHAPESALHRDVDIEPGRTGRDPQPGLFFQGPNGGPQLVSTEALEATFGAVASSVQLIVLSACYSELNAQGLLQHVGCVVRMSGAITDDAARSFAIGFYGGLGERESIAAAYAQGCAAIRLQGLSDHTRPRLLVRSGLDASKLSLAASCLDAPAIEAATHPPRRLPQTKIEGVDRLPNNLSTVFTGRSEFLSALSDAWNGGQVRLFAFVAQGGQGKTALVRRWLDETHFGSDLGVERTFVWSFYQQGTSNIEAGSVGTECIRAALKFFGGRPRQNASEREMGRDLASRVSAQRGLLALDGLEPVQWGPQHSQPGRIQSESVRSFLLSLVQERQGMCVLSSRLPLVDLEGRGVTAHRSVVSQDLPRLTPAEGARLLRESGVSGATEDLAAAADEYHGHALALTLLASLLVNANLDVRRRDLVVERLANETRHGPHARRVMDNMERWLAYGDERELRLLELVGLFDRPVGQHVLEALRDRVEQRHLRNTLEQLLTPRIWRPLLVRLRRLALLAPAESEQEHLLDTHPLIRQHFNERLRTRDPETWTHLHSVLFDHFCMQAPEQPAGLAEAEPLYRAAMHGCNAKRFTAVLHDVYIERLQRRQQYFSTRHLGGFAEDLGLLSRFFAQPYIELHPDVSRDDGARILKQSAFCLREIGRPEDSCDCGKAGLKLSLEQGDWLTAVQTLENLIEVCMLLVRKDEAIEFGERSIQYTDKMGDPLGSAMTRSKFAAVLGQAGLATQGRKYYEMGLAVESQLKPFDRQMRAYHECCILYAERRFRDAVVRAETATRIGENATMNAMLQLQRMRSWLRGFAAAAQPPELEFSLTSMSSARQVLTSQQKNTLVPRAHLLEAELLARLGRWKEAEYNVTEAKDLERVGGLLSYHHERLLTAARIAQISGAKQAALELAQQVLQSGRHALVGFVEEARDLVDRIESR